MTPTDTSTPASHAAAHMTINTEITPITANNSNKVKPALRDSGG